MAIVIIIWLILCFFIGIGAKDRGKSFVGYFFLSLLLSPIVGFIALMVSGPGSNEKEN